MGYSDEAALQSLIDNGVEERYDLEYKAADALAKTDGKKTEITRDVSAFANAAGGTIIYGMAETDHKPTAIEPINPKDFTKEWLEQVINSIEPRVPDLRIKPVEISGGLGVVYVVEIPQDTTAHQALDNRYYRRYNFQRLCMRHHEIVDVMNRARVPKLELLIGYKTEHREPSRHDYSLTLKVENSATVTAAHYKVEVTFPHPAFKARADSINASPSHALATRGLLGRREEGSR